MKKAHLDALNRSLEKNRRVNFKEEALPMHSQPRRSAFFSFLALTIFFRQVAPLHVTSRAVLGKGYVARRAVFDGRYTEVFTTLQALVVPPDNTNSTRSHNIARSIRHNDLLHISGLIL